MNKYRFSAFLTLLLLSTGLAFAQIDHLEIGLQGGGGLYKGISQYKISLGDITRTSFDFVGSSGKVPIMDQYGAFIRYRFDNHWNVTTEATRQRVRFQEKITGAGTDNAGTDKQYYNAMWHVDALVEYNILSYGYTDNWGAELEYYKATPFITIGVGMTIFNENATRSYGRRDNSEEALFRSRVDQMYPTLLKLKKYNEVEKPHKLGMYIPVGLGVKWRVMSCLQLQASMKYHLYILNGNIDGGTPTLPFDQMTTEFFKNHNALFSLGIVYNFSQAEHHTGHRVIKWED